MDTKTLRELLSPRQFEVALHIRDGRSNQEIADLMALSLNTAKAYAHWCLVKAGCDNRATLAVRVERENPLKSTGHQT